MMLTSRSFLNLNPFLMQWFWLIVLDTAISHDALVSVGPINIKDFVLGVLLLVRKETLRVRH